MVYTIRFLFSSKCSLFHNSNVFGSCIIHILYTGCGKIKKNNSGAKTLSSFRVRTRQGERAVRQYLTGVVTAYIQTDFLDAFRFCCSYGMPVLQTAAGSPTL